MNNEKYIRVWESKPVEIKGTVTVEDYPKTSPVRIHRKEFVSVDYVKSLEKRIEELEGEIDFFSNYLTKAIGKGKLPTAASLCDSKQEYWDTFGED